jgi:YVTN family beta-propeller protein
LNFKVKLINVLNIGKAFFWFLATVSVVVGLSNNPAEARPFAYVTNYLAGTVSVIDTNPSSLNFNKVVSTIQVGGDPDVIVSVPDGSRAYVTSRNSGTITVIDTNPRSLVFNKVVSAIPVEGSPGMIAFTPDGTRAYVPSRDSGTISVIDTNPSSLVFNKVVSTIDLPQRPDWIAITPDGSRAYLTSRNAGTVTVIDTNPGSKDFNKVVSTIQVGGDPNVIAFTPDGNRAYLMSPRTHSISIMDTKPGSPNYNQVVSAIGPCSFPSGIVFTPDGNHAYMTNLDSGTVSRIGTQPGSLDFNKIGLVLTVGPNPDVIAITPDGSHIYVVADNRSVVVIDTSSNTVLKTFAINNGLSSLAIVPSLNLPSNLPPVANAGGPYTVNEGGSVLLAGAATDPDYHPLTFAWDLDKDGAFDTTTPSVTFIAAGIDGPSLHTVVLKVTDIGGLTDTSEATITINNVPPTLISVVNDGPVNEGSLVRVTASAMDVMLDSLTYLFDFDNNGVFEVSQGSPSATHIYPANDRQGAG